MTPPALPESSPGYRQRVATRWNDNDMFGHVNNTIYYAAMDTAITTWLLARGKLDIAASDVLAVVVSSSCHYRESVSYPDAFLIDLTASRVGTTSITWALDLYRESDGALAATGEFVHVFVSSATRRPIPIPEQLAEAVAQSLAGANHE